MGEQIGLTALWTSVVGRGKIRSLQCDHRSLDVREQLH